MQALYWCALAAYVGAVFRMDEIDPAGGFLWCAMLAAVTVSAIYGHTELAPNPMRGDGFLTWLAYGAIGLLASTCRPIEGRVVLLAAIGAACAAAGIALMQASSLSPFPWAPNAAAPWGTQLNRLFLAGTLAMLLPIAWSLPVGMPGLMLAGILVAGERSALLAAAVGVLWLGSRCATTRAMRIFAIAAAIAAAVWSHGGGLPATAARAASPVSASQRVIMARMALAEISKRPWFGWGPKPLGLMWKEAQGYLFADEPHDEWLYVLMHFGAAGGVCYAALLASGLALRRGRRGAIIAASVWGLFAWPAIQTAPLWVVLITVPDVLDTTKVEPF